MVGEALQGSADAAVSGAEGGIDGGGYVPKGAVGRGIAESQGQERPVFGVEACDGGLKGLNHCAIDDRTGVAGAGRDGLLATAASAFGTEVVQRGGVHDTDQPPTQFLVVADS